jgi:hypothetical protein
MEKGSLPSIQNLKLGKRRNKGDKAKGCICVYNKKKERKGVRLACTVCTVRQSLVRVMHFGIFRFRVFVVTHLHLFKTTEEACNEAIEDGEESSNQSDQTI